VQSFRREKLRQLERDHEPADVIHAFELARRQFSSVALDLIFAAPDESLSQWQDDLEMAIGLEPDHISTYGLTYDKGSAFWGRRHEGSLQAVDEETERAMYQWAIDRLVAAGFEHYEVSNFARPGHHSRHNQVYWTGASYFAAGPGAARYVGGVREVNHRSTTTYLHRVLAGQSPVAEREQLDSFDRARELLVFGLRRLEGWDAGRFREQTGIGLTELLGPLLHELTQQGLLSWDGDRLKLTREGLMVSDAIWGYVFAPG
jgi:oxygen-independent coproporphyrinogen-3 oxidase